MSAVYQFVGEHLIQRQPPATRSTRTGLRSMAWLGDPAREMLLGLYDRLADGADAATLARCERNFLISSRYEWQFWDAAYRREMWPMDPPPSVGFQHTHVTGKRYRKPLTPSLKELRRHRPVVYRPAWTAPSVGDQSGALLRLEQDQDVARWRLRRGNGPVVAALEAHIHALAALDHALVSALWTGVTFSIRMTEP